MDTNIVSQVREDYFGGDRTRAARHFGVSVPGWRKWEEQGEFPAKSGRMQQAHELTGLDYKVLSPSIFKPPHKCAA